jgi:hypothetical protein
MGVIVFILFSYNEIFIQYIHIVDILSIYLLSPNSLPHILCWQLRKRLNNIAVIIKR